MHRLFFVALPFVLAATFAAACGDGPGYGGNNTPAATAAPTRAGIPADFGEPPKLGGNILKISPGHAESIKQSATRSPNPQRPNGLCAEVSFEGLPENAQWFRIAYDGAEVTPKLTWIVTSQVDPKDGKVCYAPEQGFTAGRHAVAISVQDPRNPTSAPKQVVGWAFEVTP